jgi:hypothetical protein
LVKIWAVIYVRDKLVLAGAGHVISSVGCMPRIHYPKGIRTSRALRAEVAGRLPHPTAWKSILYEGSWSVDEALGRITCLRFPHSSPEGSLSYLTDPEAAVHVARAVPSLPSRLLQTAAMRGSIGSFD